MHAAHARLATPHAGALVGERIGQYVLQRELGRGGMGVVYEAVHETIGHRAAVKVLSSEHTKGEKASDYAGRFYDEARAVNIVQHPGIVKIFDFGVRADQTVYIMMEYLEGESLWDRQLRMQRQGQRFPLADALRITRQIASALGAAHDKRIIHRDLKPENIFLVADPEVPGEERTKVLDFGIARFLDSAKRRTVAGMVMGTALYMAPEQCRGADVIDGKVDVYALGVMLYEVLAGAPPFEGEPSQVMVYQLTQEAPSIVRRVPGLPEGVGRLVHHMLAKTAAARPAMAEVVAGIKALEQELSVSGPLNVAAVPQRAEAAVTMPSMIGMVLSGRAQEATIPARARSRWTLLSWAAVAALGTVLLGLLLVSLLGKDIGKRPARVPGPPRTAPSQAAAPVTPMVDPGAPGPAPAAPAVEDDGRAGKDRAIKRRPVRKTRAGKHLLTPAF